MLCFCDILMCFCASAKKDMGAATDPMVKAVQNGRQLALKVGARSDSVLCVRYVMLHG
jgi:hypothetical protein